MVDTPINRWSNANMDVNNAGYTNTPVKAVAGSIVFSGCLSVCISVSPIHMNAISQEI